VRSSPGLVLLSVLVSVSVSCQSCHRARLPPRPDGAAVVVTDTTPAAEADVPFANETEPNDSRATAQRIDLAPATPVRGISASLHEGQGKARDADFYRIDLSWGAGPLPTGENKGDSGAGDGAAPAPVEHRLLRVDVRPEATLAVAVDALDDAGQTLVSAGGAAAGEATAIPNLAVSPGTYYLRVRSAAAAVAGAASAAGPGAYRLVARLLPPDPGGEIEPNGKAALASELAADGEAAGYFGWRKDQDWFRVPVNGLAEGSVLSADLEPVPGVTASLAVFDSVEQKLTEARGRKEERVALRNVRIPPGESHLYVVVRADGGFNTDVRYGLRLRSEVPKAGGEVEPNDDVAHAQPVADGTTLGYLGRGDVDVFRYSAPGPLELDIEAEPPERVDVKLEILRPDGSVLARADTGRRREAERIPNLFVPGGVVFIRLSAGKGDGNPDEPYHLTIASRPPDPGAEREPNDTIASPSSLAVGATGSGLIAPRGDVDFWQAPGTPDAEGNLPITVTGVPGFALEVRVRSQSGRELARFKVANGAQAQSRVVTGGDACCLVEIREPTGRGSNPRDRYTLVVGK
jgi:hypothetical protein